LIKNLILLLGYLIVDFIHIFDGTIPALWHHLEFRLVGKGSDMEFSVMGFEKSAK
jgi:hypothetical protein